MLTQGNIPAHPDQKYVDALVNNDSVILNLVYKKFLPPIQRMVLQNNGSDDDAYDLFQNALLSIYNKYVNLRLANQIFNRKLFSCYNQLK